MSCQPPLTCVSRRGLKLPKSKLSAARIKANKKWDEQHRQRVRYLQYRSTAKNFILKRASHTDLVMLQKLITERLQQK